MARLANVFSDPFTGETYVWPVNHDTEEEFGRAREVSAEANTANIGLVRVQGAKSPMGLRVSGSILTRAQHDAFWSWYERCEVRTIVFTDFAGNRYECIIKAYHPLRRRTMFNRQDPDNAPHWYWTYTMEFDILRVLDGPLAGVVTP